MFGHDDDKKKARRPLPQGILSRTMPPHKPRDDKAAETAAKARSEASSRASAEGFDQNAHAFGQNSQLQQTFLPMRPSSSHTTQYPPGPAPPAAAQGYHSKASSRSSSGNSQRELPSVFGFDPPSTSSREKKKAPYPVSMYGDAPQPEPQPAAFGLLSSPTVLPAHHRPASSASVATSGSGRSTHEYFPPGLVHPHAALHMHSTTARVPSPQPHQAYPPTPPRYDNHGRLTPPSAATQNQLAFLQNSNVGQTFARLGKSEIRLIRIQPQESGPMKMTAVPVKIVPLKVTFTHTQLAFPHVYTAISYTRGKSEKVVDVELNGNPFQIPYSLHEALLSLRSTHKPVLCWADALCINRKDDEEVTNQVLLMRDIYAFASCVAVWLGPSDKHSEIAIRMLDDISQYVTKRNEASIQHLLESSKGKEGLKAIVHLFERPYWRRLWVLQEVLNSKCAIVHCGQSVVPWAIFERAMSAFRRHSKSIDKHLRSPIGSHGQASPTSSGISITSTREFLQLGPAHLAEMQSCLNNESESAIMSMKFLKMLCLGRSKLSEDPRDKVYGLLGLAPSEAEDHILPDYRISAREVYLKTARYILTTSRKLDLICNAVHYPAHVSPLDLPSWVPDWSYVPLLTAIDWPPGQFKAGGDACEEIAISNDGVLGFNAVYMDLIAQRGTPASTGNSINDLVMAFSHWYSIFHFRMRSSPEATLHKLEEQFCRMLVFSRMPPMCSNWSTWKDVTFHVFASLAEELMPEMPMHRRLVPFAKRGYVDLHGSSRESLVLDHFSPCITGRSVFFTENHIMGLASGNLAIGDEVAVALGCSTPVLLRRKESDHQHHFVSDAYVDGYMSGLAIQEWKRGRGKAVYYNVH